MKREIAGKVVLITGPARGIGEATARRLASRGATLALIGREPDRLAALATELGAPHSWAECDVTVQSQLDAAVRATIAAHGRIDVVVANAGIASHGTVALTPADALARTVEVNLIGVIRTVRATLDAVTAQRGYYLLISSAAALAAMPGIAAYAASKAGVEMFGNVLRLELRHKGVQVGSAHPGWIDTDMVRDVQHDSRSFTELLATLPGPFGTVTPVEVCAEALVDAIIRRRRKVFIPKTLGPLAAIRQLFMSPLSELAVARHAARMVPAAEREMQLVGRIFGKHSVEANRPKGKFER